MTEPSPACDHCDHCDHIALLTADLDPLIETLSAAGLPVGPVEEFPGEGTKEVYVGEPDASAKLLLLAPAGEGGPYARALEKRGPGIHHLAFVAKSPTEFLAQNPGWLLHPQSLELYRTTKTLWAARPGVGTLLEISEGERRYGSPALVESLSLPCTDAELAGRLLSSLAGGTITAAAESGTGTKGTITIRGRTWRIQPEGDRLGLIEE